MLPVHYFSVIRCPKCSGQLDQSAEIELQCRKCDIIYPVVDNIPILLAQDEMDAVAQEIKVWYEKNWQGQIGDTKAKKHHEDLSNLGQCYIQAGEQRYIEEMSARSGNYFLDVGCGAQPRLDASKRHQYHVCLDLSLSGLQQCREILGARGIFVVGSATNPPFAEEFAATVLASHCIYHINVDLQPVALRQLYLRVAKGGIFNIFYFNPSSFEMVATWPARTMMRALKRHSRNEATIYFHPLPVSRMAEVISKDMGGRRVLRLPSIGEIAGRAQYVFGLHDPEALIRLSKAHRRKSRVSLAERQRCSSGSLRKIDSQHGRHSSFPAPRIWFQL